MAPLGSGAAAPPVVYGTPLAAAPLLGSGAAGQETAPALGVVVGRAPLPPELGTLLLAAAARPTARTAGAVAGTARHRAELLAEARRRNATLSRC